MLQSVRQDLEDVVAIISSGKKQTNHHRALIAMLTKGMIPNSWYVNITSTFVFPFYTT